MVQCNIQVGGLRMRIVEQSIEVMDTLDGDRIVKKLEKCARKCYKSEEHIKQGSEVLLANLIKWGHESVLEHESITVDVTTSRSISHQLVRHRLASYSQESQRYCNYSKGKFNEEVTFVRPHRFKKGTANYDQWLESCAVAEGNYFTLLEDTPPELAREVLPNSAKTEIIITHNIRSWRNFFKQRITSAAQYEIAVLADLILKEFKENIPILFDDIKSLDEIGG